MPTNPHSKKITWTFIFLFLLFSIPLILASWMFIKNKPLFTHTTNHGELIQPPLDMAKLNLPVDQQIWKEHWLLLYVNPTICDKSCETAMYNMRQISTAVGKDANRVRRAILTFADQPSDSHLQDLLNTNFKGTQHFIISKKMFLNFSQENKQENKFSKITLQTGGIYLVDPLGNVMMFYTLTADPMGIFKDLTRLLKLSNIG